MILSGREIEKTLGKGIVIEPFNSKQLNPNSYNLTLHNELLTYRHTQLDMKNKNPEVRKTMIGKEGFVLKQGQLYLGRTIEYTETDGFVPMLNGRSSIGRLGIFIHVTAGFGDIGFKGYWTLEIMAIQNTRIYAGVPICQICYHTVKGTYDKYHGKYQNNTEIQASKIGEDL